MTTPGEPKRPGFHTVTPYMIVNDGAGALAFYKKAFGATETYLMADAEGKVRHAEIMIGNSMLMLTEENPEFPEWLGPKSRGGTALHLYLYVEDADAIFNQAVSAGATVMLPLEDHSYGDRSGGVVDPFGHIWYIATHLGMPSGKGAAE